MVDWLFPAMMMGSVAAAGAAAWFLDRDRRIRRALRSVRPKAIRDVADGKVAKIAGTVELLGAPLIAPISGRRCAFYELVVKQHQGRAMRVVARDSARRDFAVRDATGRALVHLTGATVSIVRDASLSTGVWNAPTPEIDALLRRLGVEPKMFLLPRSFQYEEGVLEPGEGVAVGGLARWEPDPDPPPDAGAAFREAPRRLVLQASGEMPLFVSDDPATLR